MGDFHRRQNGHPSINNIDTEILAQLIRYVGKSPSLIDVFCTHRFTHNFPVDHIGEVNHTCAFH
jgi:hypothetical protein